MDPNNQPRHDKPSEVDRDHGGYTNFVKQASTS